MNEKFDYPDGCVVLDNPPFSILTPICKYYIERDIKFFLFAPALTGFSAINTLWQTNHIFCGESITYDNGAVVRTGFVTNLTDGIIAQTAPELGESIKEACKKSKQKQKTTQPRYEYPVNILIPAMVDKYAKHKIDFKVRAEDCIFVRCLDAQKEKNKSIYGGGLLVSNRVAAAREDAEKVIAAKAAEERAARITWELSERERQMIENID